jgi:hypothetical protein
MLRSRRLLHTIGALLCLAALMVACGSQSPTPGPAGAGQTGSETEPATPTAQPPATEFVSPLPQAQSPLPTPTDVTETGRQPAKPIERVPPSPAPVKGEAPQDLLDAVFDDLVERLDVGREAVAVVQAEYVIWSDGSLGCPQPDMMYTQALLPGYRIVLRVGDETFNYHAAESGYFVLCTESLPGVVIPPGGGADPTPSE